ncbi:dolichyl-phosphate mannose synthase [Marinobacter sp. Z-F4-2]|nr:dolichyl-phosphate mannose synthase [Marinobacter sp. Z-F4-2]
MDTVDFVIPHMGRPEMLRETVRSVLAQSSVEQVASITVVTKNEKQLPLESHDKLNIVYAPDAATISEQRNRGVSSGSAPLIAFLDADIGLAADWLAVCCDLMAENSKRVLVSAMQKSSESAGRVERLRTALSNVTLDAPVQFLPGRNLLVKRSAHEQVGGFPEHLQTCEDYFYTEKLSRLGELYYTSRTHYVHLGEDKSLKQTFIKEIWRSEYNLLSLAGRKVPLREWPSILLPFWMLLAFVVLVAGIQSQPWALVGAIMLMVPACLYSARLYRKPSNDQPLSFLLLFYTVYFLARAAGTVKGTRLLLKRKLTE